MSDAEDDYLRTLDEITDRLKREISNPEAVVEEVVNPGEGIDPKEKIEERNGQEDGQKHNDDHRERCGHFSTAVGWCFVSHGENSLSLKVGEIISWQKRKYNSLFQGNTAPLKHRYTFSTNFILVRRLVRLILSAVLTDIAQSPAAVASAKTETLA